MWRLSQQCASPDSLASVLVKMVKREVDFDVFVQHQGEVLAELVHYVFVSSDPSH